MSLGLGYQSRPAAEPLVRGLVAKPDTEAKNLLTA